MKISILVALLFRSIESVVKNTADSFFSPRSHFSLIDQESLSSAQIELTFSLQAKLASVYLKNEFPSILFLLVDNDGTGHFYYSQAIDSIKVLNSNANINVAKNGAIVSSGLPSTPPSTLAKRALGDPVSPIDAFLNFASRILEVNLTASDFSLKVNKNGKPTTIISKNFAPVPYTKQLYQTKNGIVKEVYEMRVPFNGHTYNSFLSTMSMEIVGWTDWTITDIFSPPPAPSSFLKKRAKKVYDYNVVYYNDPDIRYGRTIVSNPADPVASPFGWHSKGKGLGDGAGSTNGNNVKVSRTNGKFALPTKKTADRIFMNPAFDPDVDPVAYGNAAAVNTFYIANVMHDITYKYGFDEIAGNFQTNNFGRGGKGNDAIIANSQSVDGTNNANFMTPPDGFPPKLNLYFFTSSPVQRSGAFDNVIIAHEIFHGVSNRLTGGPSNANCLLGSESGGMGEGWSDFNAIFMTTKATDDGTKSRAIADYSFNFQNGVRLKRYTTDRLENPFTYASAAKTRAVHRVGEIWALILFEVYWGFIDKFGFTPNLKDGFNSGKGNTMFYQLVIDGLKLQPCNPTFVQGRDAIISADQNRNQGKNFCLLWKSFAKRGLGLKAKNFVDDFSSPPACEEKLKLF